MNEEMITTMEEDIPVTDISVEENNSQTQEISSDTETPAETTPEETEVMGDEAIATAMQTTAVSSEITETTAETAITTAETAVNESQTTAQTEQTAVSETALPQVESVTQSATEITAVTTVPSPAREVTEIIIPPQMLMLVGLIVILAAAWMLINNINRQKKARAGETSARMRDKARLEKTKSKKSRKGDRKAAETKQKTNLSKQLLDTIPYKKVLADDIFFLGNKMYSKAYTFDDINFNLADEEQQYIYLERYIEFMNMLDDTIDCQICLWNSKIDLDDFRKIALLPQKTDKYFDLRYEYNTQVLEANIQKGQNAIQKHMYVTLTIKAPDFETAQRRFKSLDLSATAAFNRIGNTNMRVLTSQERIEMLNNYFLGNDGLKVPTFTEEMFRKGTEKLYCCPDYFEFKKDYFMFGNTYAKAIYIRDYPTSATSDIINDLMGAGIEMMFTTNIETYDSADARKMVQRQITSLDTDMAKREVTAAQHGNFSNQMPQRIKNQREAMVSVFDKITQQDQKLFMVNMQMIIKATTYEELENNLDVVVSVLKRNGCVKGEMPWEQEDGLYDVLPCGYQKKFIWQRTMPSESVAIFIPFNVKEMQMAQSTYYGLNKLSNNILMFNRMTGLINPAGFILGAPGGGKSMAAKREIVDAFLRYENCDILIIDPEREYWKLAEAFDGTVVKFSTGSKNYINMFDFDLRLLEDEEIDVISDKCQLVTSFISCMDSKHPLNAQEKSFVDRCVRKAYIKSGVLDTLDPADMPTLETFFEVMKAETENVNKEMKDKLIVTIDMYVNGSAKYFNNQTNVDTNNRFVAYDIRDLNGNLKTQSMLLILDYIWNRLSRNRDLGRTTYIYFDEAHLLFADDYALEYLRMLWKRARKYGGVLTGITQNVEDLLKDEKSRSMLANSEFLLLLKQNPTDAAKLQDILHFTDSEIQYVNDTPPGHGILVLGGKVKIPFYDQFPKDTKLYARMTTNFSETAKMLEDQQKGIDESA